ncbi:glycosyltransferase [Candidatus Micrarchaeota archaeon]|nr:glycosyltransferase [Candidatus Micrarchaeota archaeon]
MFSIVIPTHNEEKRIHDTLEKLLKFLHRFRKPYEIIIVDDGHDRTLDIVSEFVHVKRNHVQLLRFNHRQGKGKALVEGMKKAKGDAIITYDADGAAPPKEIPKLLKELKRSDVVIGSRALEHAVIVGTVPNRRRIASKSFNTLIDFLFQLGVKDTQCGFKGIKRNKILPLLNQFKQHGFEWDVELLLRAKKAGLRIKEIPIEWHHKKEGKVVYRDVMRMLKGVVKLKREMG